MPTYLARPEPKGGPHTKPTTIVIVDDHPIVRKGLVELISHEPDMTICGESDTVAGGLDQIRWHRPDVAIVDLSLGLDSGLGLVKQLDRESSDVRVLILSMHDEMLHAERVLAAGARGYVMKHEATQSLVGAIRCVAGGKIYVSPAMSERILTRLSGARATAVPHEPLGRLTDREREVFTLIGRGLGTREIADRLILSVKTIETHQSRIKEKLGLTSANALIRAAVTWTQP